MTGTDNTGRCPIAIGGVGGSGTRVVAEIVFRLGIYLGWDLNVENDNLWFTLLFKRPAWYARHAGVRNGQIEFAMRLFEKTMTGRPARNPAALRLLARATFGMVVGGHDHLGTDNGLWPVKRACNMLRPAPPNVDFGRFSGWGFKEPNSHIYIDQMSNVFPDLRYIHVIRNGLDMAFSDNQAQLYNWGPLFGIETVNAPAPLPRLSLKYWIAANERALEHGRACLGDRFKLIQFERLCRHPAEHVDGLIDFLGLDPPAGLRQALYELPSPPASLGRHAMENLGIFTKDEITAVRELGFDFD